MNALKRLLQFLFHGAQDIRQLEAALDVALKTLEQIAATPRNKGARLQAAATHAFLTTQLKARNRKQP